MFTPRPPESSSVFSFRNLLILIFMLKCMKHFKLIFVFDMQWRSKFILFHVVYLVVSAPFIKKITFPPWNYLGTFVENQLTVYVCFKGHWLRIQLLGLLPVLPKCLTWPKPMTTSSSCCWSRTQGWTRLVSSFALQRTTSTTLPSPPWELISRSAVWTWRGRRSNCKSGTQLAKSYSRW